MIAIKAEYLFSNLLHLVNVGSNRAHTEPNKRLIYLPTRMAQLISSKKRTLFCKCKGVLTADYKKAF